MSVQTRKKRVFILIYLFWFLLLFGSNSCSLNNNSTPPIATASSDEIPTSFSTQTATETPEVILQRPEGKFLFVEAWLKIDGTGIVPGGLIDRPTYSFDQKSKELIVKRNGTQPLLNSTDWDFLGQGSSRHGSAGGGIASGIIVIQEIPFKLDITVPIGNLNEHGTMEYKLLPILFSAILSDGTLLIEINGEVVKLKPNAAWTLTKEISFSSERYNGQLKATSSITNYGWLNMESLNP